MNSRHKANIAVAHALGYFSEREYYVFLPIGDNGGAIDLAVSQDGSHLLRVQCKYTEQVHHSGRSPKAVREGRNVWMLGLRQVTSHPTGGRAICEKVYGATSFDLLFVATPSDDYLIPWAEFCSQRERIPNGIVLGKHTEQYRVS